ncbi:MULTISPECIES: DUF799 domain-containing protein [Pseudomonas]|jgi:hypothetical protein|uniref:Lipoprotein n=1 Tax=Pseudomonas lundensis TaxID=86185 RepID=A0AAP6YWW7_9PSED|nr:MULTISPECIES: DUF799 domain-containing protein [Pseudomonas]AOZ14868.1 hypothetical protein AA042_21155 [Pseudomonas lundensis]MBM1181285.1 DUF799 domain-containing protein [Pseudomonas lundensis]MBM1186234.1 DUF799 domain-containing protein [Pseudomonas lundensis]MBS5840474.1 DUF799 domain-containing protein [Pseudomonas sp.]NLU01774.1 DUF799 domain-containing protein [Pseudomonas lundensis]
MMPRFMALSAAFLSLALLGGCAAPKTIDYAAFKQSRPKSILVLPPINESPEVQASYSLVSQVTYPLAEAGYYVLPIALVDETFRQNGLTTANDIQAVAPAKLQQIFGADAGLYITITEYGTQYMLISSDTAVTATAKLVDLKTGTTLWTGVARASSEEGNSNAGGIVGMLITAAVKQVINSSTDAAHPIAGVASARLLSAGQRTGILYGPRSPKYGSD